MATKYVFVTGGVAATVDDAVDIPMAVVWYFVLTCFRQICVDAEGKQGALNADDADN